MKLTIKRAELKHALQGLGKVIPRKSSTLPVLQCVRFMDDRTGVTATATDLDQTVSYRFPKSALVESGTSVVLELQHLKPLCTGKPSENIEITPARSGFVNLVNHIAGRAVSSEVPTMDPQEWPAQDSDITTYAITPAFLANFRRTLPFASRDETRMVLNGVYLDISRKDCHCMVTTDGRRLTCCNTLSLPVSESCIIPSSKFLAWNKLDGDMRIGTGRVENALWFRLTVDSWTYQAKTIEGTYPNWRQVVPDSNAVHTIEFGDKDVDLLKQVLPSFPGNKGTTGEVVVIGENNTVTMSGRDSEEASWSTLALPHSRHSGPDSFAGVDRRYLLQAFDAGFTRFTFADSMSPLHSSDGKGAIHVLMPVRTEKPEVKAKKPVPVPVIPTKKEDEVIDAKREPEPTTKAGADQLWITFQNVKDKVRDLNSSITELGNQLRQVKKQDKAVRTELDNARGVLSKLKSISI